MGSAAVATGGRSMAPREHGAYAQLGVPLFAVLLAAVPSVATLALMVAAAAGFSAHEPLLVLLGQRGSRAHREERARARSRLVSVLGLALMAALVCVALDTASRVWLLVPGGLAAVALAFTVRQRERTLAGELAAAFALTSVALPCAVASGLSPRQGLAICGAFLITSVVSTVEVRAVVRRGRGLAARIVGWPVALSGFLLLYTYAPLVALATTPVLLVLLAVAVLRPVPAQLRRVGWALAASSVVMAIAVALATRAS